MGIVLREMPRDTAGLRFADGYPTEFSAGMIDALDRDGMFGTFFVHRAEDDVVVGEIGGAFVDEQTIEIGYAVLESQWGRGYASAAVTALVAKAREDGRARRVVGHTPLDRPRSARVLEKAGFALLGETVDEDDVAGGEVRVQEWELGL